MRYLSFLVAGCFLAACSATPTGKSHGVDSVSPEGEPLRTYSAVNIGSASTGHNLRFSAKKLVFLGQGQDQTIMADDITVAASGWSGKLDAELKAGTLFYHPASRWMEFGAGLLWDLNAPTDVQVEMDHLSWDMNNEHFLGKGGVRLFGPKAIIEGKSIVFDILLNAYRIDSVQSVYKYDQTGLQQDTVK